MKLLPVELLKQTVEKALKEAYRLGQVYWQQADSEYVSQQNKSDATAAIFRKLISDTLEVILPDAPDVQGDIECTCADKDMPFGRCCKAPTQSAVPADLDSRDFYELMQAYRHCPVDAVKEFESVKNWLRDPTYTWGASPQPQPTPDDVARDAALDWLDNNTTYMEVIQESPKEGPNIPVLASVSKRIWYHATDDITSYPFSAVIAAARSTK